MNNIKKIWWIRHLPIAETGRYIGQTDVPAIMELEPANFPVSLPDGAAWVASPLLRAKQTAHWLMKSVGATTFDLAIADELAEQHFGVWEGKTYDEVWQIEQKNTMDWASPAMVKPEGGESFIGVCARLDHWLDKQLKEDFARPLVVVAHAGTIRAALRHALNIKPEPALSFAVDHGSITQIDYFPNDGGARVMCVNR